MDRLYHYFLRRFPEAVPYELTQEDKASIQQLTDEKYSTWEWNYGASPAFAVNASHKYDFGLVDVRLNVIRGCIKEIRIFGDFFGVRSISELEDLLTGTAYRADAIRQVLAGIALGDYISGMAAEELIELMMQ